MCVNLNGYTTIFIKLTLFDVLFFFFWVVSFLAAFCPLAMCSTQQLDGFHCNVGLR